MFNNWLHKIQGMERREAAGALVIFLCSVCIVASLSFYFHSYSRPYMLDKIIDLSPDWQYSVDGSEPAGLTTLGSGPFLKAGQTLTLSKTLRAKLPQAAILIRTNHQTLRVLLDESVLHWDQDLKSMKNPGMALYFIPLPEDYTGKRLTIELTSPYTAYAGRTGPVLLGNVQSLEAWALSQSMRSVIMMSMCLLLGLCTIALTLAQTLFGVVNRENFAIGVFAVVWALYYVCTEYIVFQFFPPVMVSVVSLALYYSFVVPLTLYFYFSFRYYKKWMLPAVIVHGGFAAVAFILQLTGLVDLPRLLHINNALLTGLIYTFVLVVLEAVKHNRMMSLSAPFLFIAYASMLYNFGVFYLRRGVVPYSYRDTYFLLILCVLAVNIQQFFSRYYRERREGEVLALQNRQARDSYDRIVNHLKEVGGLKHELKNHLTALQAYLCDGRVEEAKSYLDKYAVQSGAVTETVCHENFLINAVASNLLRQAAAAGIRAELDLKASPHHIEDPDLYSLLVNILENALEACRFMPDGRERYIRLTISRRNPYLSFICENSYSGEIRNDGEEILTTKKDSGHGYGLWTIRRIARRYEGLVDADFDEKSFTLTVALKDA